VSPIRPTLTVIGRRLDPGDYALRDFLTRAAQPYEFHQAGSPEAERPWRARAHENTPLR
jgi:hypothetical protein